MEAEALLESSRRSTHRPIQLVLVRANAPLFYSLAAASLLEDGMPLAADRLLHFFGGDQLLAHWVRAVWLPRKQARAAQLREYVATTWPEYDWYAGYEHYRAVLASPGGCLMRRPSGVHEALARCVATAQASIFYRSLAQWAEDRRLRVLAAAMALEESEAFTHFRELYNRQLRDQGFPCPTAWTTAFECVRAARDNQVPRAFEAINAQCAPNVPFPVLDYPEFVARMGAVIERHGNLGRPERLLFRTWKGQPRVRAPAIERRAPAGFRPMARAAA